MKSLSAALIALLMSFSVIAFAHGGKDHKKDSSAQTSQDSSHQHVDTAGPSAHIAGHHADTPPLDNFPNLHPLIVHFPIVLLIIAALMQWISLFVFKKELTWVAWSLLILGFIGAYMASGIFHAHTSELPEATQHILEEHEQYASYTQWFAGIALLLQSINLFFMKQKTIINWIVVVLMSLSAGFVALSGHHGAELVHKHGVGAKGNMLEQHHH